MKKNSLANHGGLAINAIEAYGLQRPKQMKDVVTSRRFIFEALQEESMVSFDGHKGDSRLMHPGASHDMETCSMAEELLQQIMDQGRFEISEGNKGEQHICMQSADKESPTKPKPLVIHLTRDVASQKPQGSRPIPGSKPVPFPYQSNKAVSWRYAPRQPSEKRDEAVKGGLPSSKVTNIASISGVTRSGRVFTAPDPLVRSKDSKGKAKVIAEETNEVSPTLDRMFWSGDPLRKEETSTERKCPWKKPTSSSGPFNRVISR